MNYYLKVLKQYADFNGRARRKEYWMFVLFNFIVGFLISITGGMMGAEILYTIYSLAVIIPSIAVGVRRMHDVGKSGWYLLIPIYNFILACTDGDSGDNEYGSNPKTDKEAA